MMKNLKTYLLSFVLIAGFLTACSNNDSVVEEQNINESAAITQSLNRLAQQYNNDGYVITSENPSGNIVFDFCFDFVYPLNLSYNNGTTVAINSLDDLIIVIINSTDDLFINGVEFPFDVETYNGSGAIEIVTINNEDEFINLLEDCDFDSIDECECYEDYNPVCVEVQAPDGVSFIVTYPNECYAICDGFTPNNFVENCANDGNNIGGFECFDFNFPLTIVTDNNQTITVNSQQELDNALYNAYYFDFVFPFEVTDDEGNIIAIQNENDLINLLDDCFDENDCPCTTEVNPVCVEVVTANGETEIITFLNGCEAECEGFTDADFVDCNTNPTECSELDVDGFLSECSWYINTNLYDNVVTEYFEFSANGALNVTNSQTGETTEIGSWGTIDPQGTGVQVYFNSDTEPYAELSSYDWTVTICSEEYIMLESGDEFIHLERECNVTNPYECNEQELFGNLLQCNWYINTSLYNNVNASYAHFFQNNIVEITNQGTNETIGGDWWLTSNPSQGFLLMSFNISSSPYNVFSEYDWFVTQCSEDFILLESGDGNEFIQLERNCD